MLTIEVPIGVESFDEANNKFVNSAYYTLEFEHSLASLSKWEAKYEKPFLGKEDKTIEETLYYIEECMLLTKNPPEGIFQNLSKAHFDEIQEYINAKRSATTIKRPPGRGPQQLITSAVVYGWMVHLRIPFETQYWHFNELMMLIDVCNEQKKPPKKMSRGDAARQQAALNAQRQAQMRTRG